MKKKKLILILCAVWILIFNSAVSADSPAEQTPYQIESDDGIYFINISAAIEFYKNGILIKQYFFSDLFEDKTKSEYSVSFDSENNILSVMTEENMLYKFDITTGDIIEKANMAQNIAASMTLLLMVIGAMSVMMIMTKKNAARYRRG